MRPLNQMVCMGILAGLSAVDIYSRKIPAEWLAVGNLLAVGYQIFIGKGDIWLIAGGTGVGAIFFLISRITGESVGYGDSWAILIMGIYLGIWELLAVLAGAFFLLAVVSAVVLTVRKMSRRSRIPFIPFLMAGYLANVFWR